MESLLEKSNIARQKGRYWRKIRNIVFLVLLFGFFCWGAIKFYYPYEEGIETGKLKYVVYKGFVFKTYEGMLIRTDEKITEEVEVLSNEFEFSIAKKSIAEKLMHAGGKTVELHYTKYLGAIPWRGYSRFVVDGIVEITEEKEPFEMKLIAEQIEENGTLLSSLPPNGGPGASY